MKHRVRLFMSHSFLFLKKLTHFPLSVVYYMNRQVEKLEIERVSHQYHDSKNRDELLVWLMDEYGKSLVRLAFMYVKNEQLAEDIVQDAFVKCYNNLNHFQGKSSYKTWLYQITVNCCKDKLRSWAYRNMVIIDFFSFQEEAPDRSPEENLLLLEENSQLSKAIISLPLKLRETIIFYYYEELRIEEISNLLGVSSNTVKSRLRRGKEVLKNRLNRGDFRGR
jgi:RNA polymerase sigma factor (sigma-70 family)